MKNPVSTERSEVLAGFFIYNLPMHPEQTADPYLESVEAVKADVIKQLENEFPKDETMVTASDIRDLALLNACLSIQNEFVVEAQDKAATEVGLKYERDRIIAKVIDVVSDAIVLDALTYPNESYIEGNLTEFTDILDKVEYLLTPEQLEQYAYDSDSKLRTISDALLSRVQSGEATSSELVIALDYAKQISRFSTWGQISDKCIALIENGPDVGRVEQLLQEIHQGNYEFSGMAELAQRPLLERISDRPWEVANALTLVYAGFPGLIDVGKSSSINRYTSQFRNFEPVSLFYMQVEPDVEMLRKTLEGKDYFQAAISLSRSVESTVLDKAGVLVEPSEAYSIIVEAFEV